MQTPQVPFPSQTMLVPQLMPPILLLPSAQVIAPVMQEFVPFLQMLGLPLQEPPAVQAMQVPFPSQTMLVPQLVPPILLLLSAQVWAPVAHEVVPYLHAFGLAVHGWPALQAAQVPLPLHTIPTPQLVPAALFAPSAQVVAVPEQVVVPCLHGVGLPVQLWFATHAPQKPLPSHSWPPVQVAVAGLGVPSTQVDAPVTQEVTPFRQIDGLVVQAVPAVHATQMPEPLQTWLLPQFEPAAVLPLSMHLGAPVVQSTTPVLQGAPGFMLHALPASHVTHCPLPLHTMFEPHAVPAPTSSPSMQPEPAADIPQVMTPSLQAPPGFVLHTVPAAHVMHAPALQTLSGPHDVPSGALMSSRHCGAPVEQAIAPFLQGLPGLVKQEAPVAQGMQVPAALQT